MKRVFQIDHGTLGQAEMTPQGFLRVRARITRTGVFRYRMADGTIKRRLRHPDDVFDPKSMASFAGLPITDEHPPKMLDASNAKDFSRGHVGDSIEIEDNRYLCAPTMITDAALIQDVMSGKKVETSSGYYCEIDETPGVYEGEEYDDRQVNIVGNHVAATRSGRAGPSVRFQLDSADAVQVDHNIEGDPMLVKVSIGGKEFEVSPEVKAALDSLPVAQKAQLDSAVSAHLSEKARADALQGTVDALKGEIEALKAKVQAHTDSHNPKAVFEAAKARIRCLKAAERVLDDTALETLDSMSDHDIKVAVIKVERPKMSLEGKQAPYIDAAFDQICDSLESDDGAGAKLGAQIQKDRAEGGEDKAAAAKKAMNERDAAKWKTPTAK